MQISSNISTVFGDLASKFSAMTQPDGLLREIATSMHPIFRDRIHVDGLAADGSQIGIYSEGYMAVRTGIYKNSEKNTKGKNKGKVKNAGRFTKGNSLRAYDDNDGNVSIIGAERPRYNRNGDKKVILSLTRQMESDLSVQPTEKGYGLGYNNSVNADKAKWAEERYKKKIFALMDSEKEQVIEIANAYTDRILNG